MSDELEEMSDEEFVKTQLGNELLTPEGEETLAQLGKNASGSFDAGAKADEGPDYRDPSENELLEKKE